MKEQILIDTDPGQDDALALLLAMAAQDRLHILGITTVAGNVPLERTTANALRVRDLAGYPDVPVHAGATQPIVVPLETAEFVSGPDGLAGADLPPPKSSAAPGHAVDTIIAMLRAAPEKGVTLCALGPLTNIALALRLAPDTTAKVKRIVLMGGALGLGNMTPAAEFNFYVDPHAAAIVYASDIPIVMFGLNLTQKVICPPDQMERIACLGTATGRAVHGMLTRPRPGGLGTSGHPMHDPCVIAWLLWPELFGGRDCHVEIDSSPGSQRGRTTIDWNNRLKLRPNALVMDSAEVPTLFGRMIDAIATLP